MSSIDVVQVRREVVDYLREWGWSPRDADPTDFASSSPNAVRFKVGTSRGEVAITIWEGSKQIGVHRITSASHLPLVLHELGSYFIPAGLR